jgi:GDP-L-fucose synthase
METNSKILVAGSNGMVGSAIVRNLEQNGYAYILKGTRERVDFTNQKDTFEYFQHYSPEYVFLAAAKVGGILENSNYKADFLLQNLQIQNNIIDSSFRTGVKKLLFLGSSCIYPKFANQPITEDQLMTGPLEPTNDAYAIAKIAGIKLCQSYREQYGFNAISLMPTNLYGPRDNFDLKSSHVLPALIRKVHESKIFRQGYVECWGDGTAMREFLYVDDLAEACRICMEKYDDSEIINVGTGIDISIKDLLDIISRIIDHWPIVKWDKSKPNGTPRKVLNVDKIKSLGWQPNYSLSQGIHETYYWYLKYKNTSNYKDVIV